MSLAIARFGLFALLVAATFAKCQVKHKTRNRSKHELARSGNVKSGILAGEDTPVWLARRHYPYKTIVYQRSIYLRTTASTAVKESLKYWNSIKSQNGFRVRKKPKFNRNESDLQMTIIMLLTYIKQFTVPGYSGNERSISFKSIAEKKIENNITEEKVLHPSVLVVMDYHDVHPHVETRVRWQTKEMVLYALAFWGTVGRSLRQIRNPRVSLRIAGIVISTTRHASPYLKENQGRKTLVNALPKMLRHWKKVAKENSDFRIGSYDIVAHMTDIHPRAKCKKCAAPDQKKPPIFCAASKGPPCKLPDKIAGFIIHDDFAFKGLYLAISWMPRVFGSKAPPRVYNRRKWTTEILDPISTALEGASCMSAAKGSYPPGKRVPLILAGELFPGVKQCEAAGYKWDAWTCWHTNMSSQRSSCQYLACSNHHNRNEYCSQIGRTLDGTFCDKKNRMICLNGDCVKKK